ncbi:MAG TPA: DUF896 domain-containing protein [Oscillospiraceae bacterium]|nr:DUF896 domain-containing protein [Oscillospiraceae bacterium]
MEQEKLDRISELARKHREKGLTGAEKAEREALRAQYRAAVRKDLETQLENTWVVDEAGNKTRLRRRDEVKDAGK